MKLRLTVLRLDDEPKQSFSMDIVVDELSPQFSLSDRLNNDKMIAKQIADSFAKMILLHLNQAIFKL